MAQNNAQQLARILIAIAKNAASSTAEKLEATRQLLELQTYKAGKQPHKRRPKPKASGSLLGE